MPIFQVSQNSAFYKPHVRQKYPANEPIQSQTQFVSQVKEANKLTVYEKCNREIAKIEASLRHLRLQY